MSCAALKKKIQTDKGAEFMAWYNENGTEKDVVISSRIRLARNLKGIPFDTSSKSVANQVIDTVKPVLEKAGYEYTDFSKMPAAEAQAYVERHIISPDFAKKQAPHGLLCAGNSSVMLCEEDHIRLQVIKSGLALNEAFDEACRADEVICKGLDIAFDEKFGFLTHCPTNIGTGLRASVMLFLPALTITNRLKSIASQLSKFGLTIRGLYGEGSVAGGCLYQISNQITIGISEEDIIKNLEKSIAQIANYERSCRESLVKERHDELYDTIYRALGTLNSAYMISSEETMKLYAYVRLGISCGIVSGIEYQALDEILIDSMPAALAIKIGTGDNARDRDKARAAQIQKALARGKNSK